MKTTSFAGVAGMIASLILAASVAGCRIHEQKGANGQDAGVQVDTPFGGVHVHTGQIKAADLGLPEYPGAQLAKGRDGQDSADVDMGFGDWQLHVRTASYQTGDATDRVVAFYKQALGSRYGDVLTCQDNAPVGAPTRTSQGLTCDDNGRPQVQIDNQGATYGYHSGKYGLELKAGSERHQHIVGFEAPGVGQTRFALVTLDLPSHAAKASQ